jgi:hypothetical protein
MIENYVAIRRAEPLHSPAVPVHAAVDKAKDNALQLDAAANSGVQVDAAAPLADFTISVEQVREHFRSKGLPKSKDTIQRWCRAGDLDCRKQGVFGRYFVTETSLLKLERKLLPDMIAEQSGHSAPAAKAAQPDAAANAAPENTMQVHTPADEPARSGMPVNAAEDAAACSDTQLQEDATTPLPVSTELASLRAENTGLKEQLAEAKDNAKFLREEIVSARGQRGDVVKIAEQMLGTLETMAVGGRLKRTSEQGSGEETAASSGAPEAVRYREVDAEK